MNQISFGFMYFKKYISQEKWCQNRRRGIYLTSNKRVNRGHKIWRPVNWSGKSSMEMIQKCHHKFLGKSYERKMLWYGGRSCKILQSCGVYCIFTGALLRLSLRLLPQTSRGIERWTRRAISVEDCDQGNAVLRQFESHYAGWLLLDSLRTRSTGKFSIKSFAVNF